MFSVAINGLLVKAFSTLHYKSSLLNILPWSSQMKIQESVPLSQVIKPEPKAGKIWMSFNFFLDPLTTES